MSVATAWGSMPRSVRRRALAWGDLVMMRRQLHNFRRLAEATARRQPLRLVAEPPG